MRRLLTLLILLLFCFSGVKPVLADEFELIGTHPGAASQSTSLGRKLHGAFVYQDKIYWGYGDWKTNTGPIDVIPLDLASLTFLPSEVSARTEAIYNYRLLPNGKLYIPHIDPHSPGMDVFLDMDYSRRDDAGWVQTPVGMYHVFDVLELNNNIYLFGSFGANAVVYEGTNNESSFQSILTQAPGSLNLVRFYFAFVWAGKLYTQAAAGVQRLPTSKIYDGAQWTDGPDLLPNGGYGSYSNPFAGKVIYKSRGGSESGVLYAFDGVSASQVRSNIMDYAIYNDELFVLQTDGVVVKTANLTDWVVVSFSGVPSPTSITLAQGRIFIGTANSRVYRSTFTVTNEPQPITSLSLTSDSPNLLGQSTTLTAHVVGGPADSYEWNFGDESLPITSTTSVVSHLYPELGTFTTWVTATNSFNSATASTTVTIEDLPASQPFYFSLLNSGSYNVGSVTGVRDEDILSFDGANFGMVFDGSDVGVSSFDLDALYPVDEDTLLMSFDEQVSLGSLGTVDDEDIIQFDAVSLGNNTAGSFSWYFDGSDVGLDTNAEDIDALALLENGQILISTVGSIAVPGVSGKDEDVLAFTPTNLGTSTSGAWALYFDGSDVELATDAGEDVDGISVAADGALYLTTRGHFAVSGIAGEGEDVFVCAPISVGNSTACNFVPTLFFDGSAWGLAGNSLDGLAVVNTAPAAPPAATTLNSSPIAPAPTFSEAKTESTTITFLPIILNDKSTHPAAKNN